VTKVIEDSVAQKFMDLFRGRTDEYGLRNIESGASWYEGTRDSMGEIMYDPEGNRIAPTGLTLEDYKNHLNYKDGIALAIIPNSRTGNVWFGCLDIDKDDIDHIELVRRIQAFGLPLHVFISRSGAAHVYIFFDKDGKPANLVRNMLQEYALALGCGKDLPKAEIFPNQDDFDETVLGHHITIPLYNSADPKDRRGKFVSPTGELLGVQGFLDRVEVWPAKKKMPFPVRSESFEMGPPCLETIQRTGGIQAGSRNNGLYNVGVYLKKAYPDDWEERLISFNRLYMIQQVDRKEVDNIVRSLKKKDYKYTCQKEPIASFCEKAVCEKRQFGIRSPEQAMIEAAKRVQVPISGLRKFTTDPPTYELLIGQDWMPCDTRTLSSWALLRIKLMEFTNELPPMMKQQIWEIKLSDLLKNELKIVDVGMDTGDLTVALEVIESMVRRGTKSRDSVRDDVWLRWDKYRLGSHAHTTLITAKNQLANNGITMTTPQVSKMFKMSGWDNVIIRLDSATTIRCWRTWREGLCPPQQDREQGDETDECDSGEFSVSLHEPRAESNPS
jgi:hypothetical protein